ncbi:MAG: cupin domain-containing protein [Candidatus Limnocylindrales bacterium]
MPDSPRGGGSWETRNGRWTRPRHEDEIYVVMRGRGRLRMDDDDVAVAAGSVAFVAAGIEHRFHDVTERLEILVAFGPAEYARLP